MLYMYIPLVGEGIPNNPTKALASFKLAAQGGTVCVVVALSRQVYIVTLAERVSILSGQFDLFRYSLRWNRINLDSSVNVIL